MTHPTGVSNLLLAGLTLLVATIAVLLLIAGWVLMDRERAHETAMNTALLESIRGELQVGYAALEEQLREREPVYRDLHAQAREAIQAAGWQDADLDAIADRLGETLGDTVHLYIINPEKTVVRSTFPPDRGLDFTDDGFADVRAILDTVQRENRTLVGPPTLEVASREFRIYSYSPLGDAGYSLELGFSPDAIAELFGRMDARMDDHAIYRWDLFFLFQEDWLMALTPRSAIAGLSKEEAYEQIPEASQGELRLFHEAIRQRGIHSPPSRPDQHYAWLNRIELNEGEYLDVVARLEMQQSATDSIQDMLITVFAVVTALVLLAAIIFHLGIRRLLAVPLRHAAAAAANREPITVAGPFARVRELHTLAEHINRGLEKSRMEVTGLDRLAHTDALTGLPNRLGLDKQLTELTRLHRAGEQPLALAVIDLDHFKTVNDEQGHATGDRILQRTAEVLRGSLREGDTIGRWGGEEFVVLMPRTDRDAAREVANRLRRALAADTALQTSRITASGGIAVLTPQDSSATLFQRADEALYAAKKAGRDRVVTAQDQNEPSVPSQKDVR